MWARQGKARPRKAPASRGREQVYKEVQDKGGVEKIREIKEARARHGKT